MPKIKNRDVSTFAKKTLQKIKFLKPDNAEKILEVLTANMTTIKETLEKAVPYFVYLRSESKDVRKGKIPTDKDKIENIKTPFARLDCSLFGNGLIKLFGPDANLNADDKKNKKIKEIDTSQKDIMIPKLPQSCLYKKAINLATQVSELLENGLARASLGYVRQNTLRLAEILVKISALCKKYTDDKHNFFLVRVWCRSIFLKAFKFFSDESSKSLTNSIKDLRTKGDELVQLNDTDSPQKSTETEVTTVKNNTDSGSTTHQPEKPKTIHTAAKPSSEKNAGADGLKSMIDKINATWKKKWKWDSKITYNITKKEIGAMVEDLQNIMNTKGGITYLDTVMVKDGYDTEFANAYPKYDRKTRNNKKGTFLKKFSAENSITGDGDWANDPPLKEVSKYFTEGNGKDEKYKDEADFVKQIYEDTEQQIKDLESVKDKLA